MSPEEKTVQTRLEDIDRAIEKLEECSPNISFAWAVVSQLSDLYREKQELLSKLNAA
jgi:hypothetical protein